MGSKRIGLARVEALLENLKRDLQMGEGTILSGHRRRVITWAADKTLTATDSGCLVIATQGGSAIDLELPTAANAGSGWEIDVILGTAGAQNAAIDFQADTALVFIHLADGGTDSNAATVQTKQSMAFAGGNATVGSRINIVSDGTKYYVTAHTGTAAEITVSDSGLS